MEMTHATRPGLVLGFHGFEETVKDALITGRIKMIPADSRTIGWAMAVSSGKTVMNGHTISPVILRGGRSYDRLP